MADKRKIFAIALVVLAAGIVFFWSRSSASEAEKIKESCAALEKKESCYGKAFASYTKKTDMARAFETLHELQVIDEQARGCHFIAHSISIAETQKDPSKWREVMMAAPPECSYGAAHGALEVHASAEPNGRLSEAEIPDICPNPDTKNCTHILGHLLLVMKEDDLNGSLANCESLPHGAMGIFECLTGVFMERITAINLEAHGLASPSALNWPERVPELKALCQKQSGERAVACWKELVHVLAAKYGPDMNKVGAECAAAPAERARQQCLEHAVGVIGGMLSFDFAKTREICLANVNFPGFKERCYPQLISSTLSTLPREANEAKAFCGSIEERFRAGCLESVRLMDWNKPASD